MNSNALCRRLQRLEEAVTAPALPELAGDAGWAAAQRAAAGAFNQVLAEAGYGGVDWAAVPRELLDGAQRRYTAALREQLGNAGQTEELQR